MYIIDENLAVYSPRYQLANAKTLELLKQAGQGSEKGSLQGETDAPIPVSLDGLLKAGALYESSSEPMVRYYLPRYQLRAVNNQFTTALKWRMQNDPKGALAGLLIELTPEVPQLKVKTLLREIQHQAIVRIVYQLPLKGQPAGDHIQQNASLQLEVGALEVVSAEVRRCHLALNSKEEFDRVFQIMTDDRFQARLQIDCFAQIGHRTWRQVVSDRVGLSSQGLALSQKQVLVTDMVDESNLELVNPQPNQASVKTRYINKALGAIDLVKVVEAIRQVEPSLEQTNKVDLGRILSRSPALESRVNLKNLSMARFDVSPLAVTPLSRTAAETIVLQPQTSRVFARPLLDVLQKTDLSVVARGMITP